MPPVRKIQNGKGFIQDLDVVQCATSVNVAALATPIGTV